MKTQRGLILLFIGILAVSGIRLSCFAYPFGVSTAVDQPAAVVVAEDLKIQVVSINDTVFTKISADIAVGVIEVFFERCKVVVHYARTPLLPPFQSSEARIDRTGIRHHRNCSERSR